MALFASAQKITKGGGWWEITPPPLENMKCAILFMRSRNDVHHTFYSVWLSFVLIWLQPTHHTHLLEAGIRIAGISRGAFAGDQSQPTKSLRSCLVSSWHRLSLLPFLFCFLFDFLLLTWWWWCSWHPFKLRARARRFCFSITPQPKKTRLLRLLSSSFPFYILVRTNKYACVAVVIALGCFIGDVYTRREADA